MNSISKLATASAIAIGALAGTAIALAQGTDVSVSRPTPTFLFGPTGVKTEIGELKASPAYGDLGKGQHGTFIKMPAKFVSPLHTHTEDYFGVVIQGIGVNTQEGKQDVQLPVGSYWLQKGKEKHVTKCVSDTDCLFFIYQPGKFDYVPAK
jgi:beta-alanine degradation protein BauB